jgi:hypothetical protein
VASPLANSSTFKSYLLAEVDKKLSISAISFCYANKAASFSSYLLNAFKKLSL